MTSAAVPANRQSAAAATSGNRVAPVIGRIAESACAKAAGVLRGFFAGPALTAVSLESALADAAPVGGVSAMGGMFPMAWATAGDDAHEHMGVGVLGVLGAELPMQLHAGVAVGIGVLPHPQFGCVIGVF